MRELSVHSGFGRTQGFTIMVWKLSCPLHFQAWLSHLHKGLRSTVRAIQDYMCPAPGLGCISVPIPFFYLPVSFQSPLGLCLERCCIEKQFWSPLRVPWLWYCGLLRALHLMIITCEPPVLLGDLFLDRGHSLFSLWPLIEFHSC